MKLDILVFAYILPAAPVQFMYSPVSVVQYSGTDFVLYAGWRTVPCCTRSKVCTWVLGCCTRPVECLGQVWENWGGLGRGWGGLGRDWGGAGVWFSCVF